MYYQVPFPAYLPESKSLTFTLCLGELKQSFPRTFGLGSSADLDMHRRVCECLHKDGLAKGSVEEFVLARVSASSG